MIEINKIDDSIYNIINNRDYLIIDIPNNTDMISDSNNFFYQLNLFDLLQKVNVQYLFCKVNYTLLSELFCAYVDSDYNLKAFIPWLKIPFEDTAICELTLKLKNSIDYVIIFENNQSLNIKPLLMSLLIEPKNKVNNIQKWHQYFISVLNEKNLYGLIINSNGIFEDTEFKNIKNQNKSKIELF